MKLVFRSHTNTPEEIQLGHKVGFTTIEGIDAISVTANLKGYTPFTAVLRHLEYDKEEFQKMTDNCKDGTVELFSRLRPSLILVPPTRGNTGRNRSIEHYVSKTLQICNAENFKSLHFSHFGFINSEFQQLEIFKIFSVLLNPLIYTTWTDLWTVIFTSTTTATEIVLVNLKSFKLQNLNTLTTCRMLKERIIGKNLDESVLGILLSHKIRCKLLSWL